MKILFKYFIWFLSLLFLLLYYFLGTTLGHVSIGYLLEDHYSKKMDNKLKILSLNIEQYPYILANIKVNDGAILSLKGNLQREEINISYSLIGDGFRWGDYNVSHPINLKGTMTGKLSKLLIQGSGDAFYGRTQYSFLRTANRFESLKIKLEEVESDYLLKFLKYKFDLKGKVDAFMDFEYFSSFRKKGLATINMKKATMPKVSGEVEFLLDAEISYRDLLRDFVVNISSSIGKLRVAHGYYNKSAGLIKAEYGLHINELSYFKKLFGHEYRGEFNTAGNVKYEAGKLSLLGDSTSYGGLLEYDYKNDYLDIKLKGVSLEKLLRQLSFPALLSAKVYGTASYDIKDEIVLVNTQLKETRFRRTKMTDTIYKFTEINILNDVYNNSLFTAGYQDSVLTSFLQIDNGINHLYLHDTRMNSKTNKITADFEVAIDGQEFIGEVYGTLKDPKVSLDMSKLIKYQIHKKIENFFGTGKPLTKRNTKIKLNEIKSDLSRKVKQKTRSFLDGFFD